MNARLRFTSAHRSRIFDFAPGLLACLIWSGAGSAQAETAIPCAKLSEVEMVQLLNRWRAEFLSGDATRLSALYADDATLVATKEGRSYKGKEAILSYYKDLLAKHPTLSIKPSSLTPGCGKAAISGPVVYRIAGQRKGTRTLLGGRYTAEFKFQDGAWRIVAHSLAADPRKIDDSANAIASSPPL